MYNIVDAIYQMVVSINWRVDLEWGGGGGFCLEMELFLKLYSESCLFAEEITASSRRVKAKTWKNKTLLVVTGSCTFSA